VKFKFIDREFTYDGSQLRSLYSFLEHKVQGDSMISWVGPCDIPKEKIVDGQDLIEGSEIYSEKMLHFIVEVFDAKLIQMVLLQRLFCEIVRDEIFKFSEGQINLERLGDDLYYKKESSLHQKPEKNKDLKLNISIATVSPVSGLLHFGINVSSKNTPVKTDSLEDIELRVAKSLGMQDWADRFMTRFSEEFQSSKNATQKVKWVD
jgi:uncharacterized protein